MLRRETLRQEQSLGVSGLEGRLISNPLGFAFKVTPTDCSKYICYAFARLGRCLGPHQSLLLSIFLGLFLGDLSPSSQVGLVPTERNDYGRVCLSL